MADTSKSFWSIKETAEYLGVAESTVRKLVDGKALASHRFGLKGGRIRIAPEDVKAYAESCREGPKRVDATPVKTPAPKVSKRLPPPEFDHYDEKGRLRKFRD